MKKTLRYIERSIMIIGYILNLKTRSLTTTHMENNHEFNQSAIITQQREEIEALESLVIEYQETISNLERGL